MEVVVFFTWVFICVVSNGTIDSYIRLQGQGVLKRSIDGYFKHVNKGFVK